MPRDTTTDDITLRCIKAYVPILATLAGWGVQTNPAGVPAVYGSLLLPMPQEPFPAAYVYLASQRHTYPSTGVRYDYNTISVRIIGGPVTPKYRFNPEEAVYSMITAVKNALSYYRFLENPTTLVPFPNILPEEKMTVQSSGRIQTFGYATQGGYVGYEVPTTIGLNIHVGRAS